MKRLRILLCDDESQMLSLLQSVLEPEYSVVGTAEDGQVLIAAAQALRPDLVLTDIEMPRMDGIEAVRELRKTLPDCRVIFHTSHTEPEVMAAAFSAGASGYLIKGSTQSLVLAIRTVVRHAWSRDEELAIGQAAFHMN
ncbi:MAG: response regulator transcription factor [Nitrospira sp.]|nr:response regulator transcription factor [Nitrospira sp.]